MEIEEAYKKAMQIQQVRDLVNEGFYLSSALLNQTHLESANKWILIFFNPETGKVFSVTVDEQNVSITSAQEPLKKGDYPRMSLEGKGNVQEILDLISRNIDGQITQVLVSVKPNTWEALVIQPGMKTTFLVIDASSRKVIKKERGSLLK